MRKYQQLALLVISALSVIILILYKNENNRLKDVLHVVNIFGRSDEAVLKRLETNTTKDDEIDMGPMPVWQALSENYHSYSAFWNRNELIAGGEVLALVVGKLGAIVNFGCSLVYDGGTRSVRGKFHFQRADSTDEDKNSEFTNYYFFCRVVRDFGHPEGVIFNDITNSKHIPPELRIRHIKPLSKSTNNNLINHSTNGYHSKLNLCANFVTPNRSSLLNYTKNEANLMQYFLHHQGLGVLDILIYNGDEIPYHVMNLLRHFNMHLHIFNFNFPFSMINATERIRRIIETDCLIRNTNIAKFALFLEPNEFFYPNMKLEKSSVLSSLNHFTGVNRFELPLFNVCIDRKNKLLVDSNFYDPEIKIKHKIFIYRTLVPVTTALSKSEVKMQSVELQLPMAFAHRYIDCLKVGQDGLHDWRNSVREDFMQHLQELRNELDIII